MNENSKDENSGLGINVENNGDEVNVESIKSNEELEKLVDELNKKVGEVSDEEMTDEEKRELYIKQLKDEKKVFKPLKHPTKVIGTQTVVNSVGKEKKVKERIVVTNEIKNPFGSKYKAKRKRKNALTKASRRANRK